jgi:hypothetical protein
MMPEGMMPKGHDDCYRPSALRSVAEAEQEGLSGVSQRGILASST